MLCHAARRLTALLAAVDPPVRVQAETFRRAMTDVSQHRAAMREPRDAAIAVDVENALATDARIG
jgi:hypothetical protein